MTEETEPWEPELPPQKWQRRPPKRLQPICDRRGHHVYFEQKAPLGVKVMSTERQLTPCVDCGFKPGGE
ncbi:MAG: hypothetical protein HOO67_06410 [Candidatus Peribacteraceae bacterium]|nr:hypothetical protein [Candidatus Peribacteraceae bacterium]